MIGVGQRIGGWVVEDLIALGEPLVVRAHHHEVPTTVVLLEIVANTPANEARHRRQVDTLRGLDHPVIPRLIDFGTEPERGLSWVATEAYEYELLSDRLLAGPIDWRDACVLFEQLASALAHLHAHSRVHREITPSNIRVCSDWTVRLAGFHLAMDANELGRTADAPLGDISYLAPEVIADRKHHAARADLYSLGCIFYEALTGRAAFPAALWGEKADPSARALEWKTRAEALDPGDLAPAWLSQLIRKATHPVSDKRLPDMEAFLGWMEAARTSWAKPAKLTPAPAQRSITAPAPPPMPMARPTIAGPSQAAIRRATLPPPEEHAERSGPPPALLYVAAATLGMVTALAFSALVILFVESGAT